MEILKEISRDRGLFIQRRNIEEGVISESNIVDLFLFCFSSLI